MRLVWFAYSAMLLGLVLSLVPARDPDPVALGAPASFQAEGGSSPREAAGVEATPAPGPGDAAPAAEPAGEGGTAGAASQGTA